VAKRKDLTGKGETGKEAEKEEKGGVNALDRSRMGK